MMQLLIASLTIILNDIKPYQDAIPMGTNGENDYSKWSYTLTHHYAVIKEGINKITAKLSCVDDPAKSKWYSANVTGEIEITNKYHSTNSHYH